MAICVGDGTHVVEWTPSACVENLLSYNAPWSTAAALLPDLDYGSVGVGPAPRRADDGVVNLGDQGPNVRAIQERCLRLGCELPQSGADGSFGQETLDAVKCVQRKLGIGDDGEWGPDTETAWTRFVDGVAAHTPPQTGQPTPQGFPAWPGVFLTNPTTGHGTKIWQQRMKDRGWSIDVNDQYGPQGETVARQFQAEKNLEVDGIVGPVTWDAAWSAAVT
jgi:peptidoglycan hydrolase-like protein with peptidoglycan-binding domain